MKIDVHENDTNNFTKENLEEALQAINSLLGKCEKSQSKVIHRISQATLLTNRIRALNVASTLISKKLKDITTNR